MGIRINYFIILIWVFQIVSLTAVRPAQGIRLIGVEPLFEISDQLNQPSDVAVSKTGLIYVVDGVNHKVRIFDPNGTPVGSIGT